MAASWSYSGDPSTGSKDNVRFLVGDTDATDQLVQDAEISAAVAKRGSDFGAAAQICRGLAAKFARRVDTATDSARLAYSQRVKSFMSLADDYDKQALILGTSGGVAIYAGGISINDKEQQEQNPDRVPPAFNVGMADNLLPVGPVGNEDASDDQPPI